MKRETQNILLILFGGALLRISLNGTYLNYVKPSLQPWLIGSGIVMAGLGLLAIVRDLMASREDGEAAVEVACGDGHGHDHDSRSPWLLLMPILAIFLIAPPALGAAAASRTSTNAVASRNDAQFSELPAGENPKLKMTDFVTRAVWDTSGTLEKKPVTLTGFVLKDGGKVFVARMSIACCVGDARPIRVRLEGTGFEHLAQDKWVEVVGRVVPNTATEANAYVPAFKVEGITEIVQPTDPYEF